MKASLLAVAALLASACQAAPTAPRLSETDLSRAVESGRARVVDDLTAVDARLVESLRSFIPHAMRLEATPGLNIALARGGRVIWEEGFGYADLAREEPMTPATVTHSGSMGKTYTATAAMRLVEDGHLELDAPVNRYLEAFQIENPLGGREVTVRDLLTHRSGLSSNAANSMYRVPPPLGEHLRASYADSAFKPYGGLISMWTAQPGERSQYSNLGIATLGYLVEVTNPDGLSFAEYVRRHIMNPLGMTSSQYPPVQDREHVRPDIFERMSTGYARFGPLRIPTPPIYFADYPAGTALTTPGDHVRLLMAYLGDGTLDGYRLLAPETVREMLTPQVEVDGSRALGLVWFLQDLGTSTRSFGHGGAHMWGWTNQFIALPEHDLAMAISMNRWDIPADGEARYREAYAIIDFTKAWLRAEHTADERMPPGRGWAWKYSYVAGLMLAERLAGALGITAPLDGAVIDDMVRGTRVDPGLSGGAELWDAAGFRTGLQDMSEVEMKPQAIRDFMRSGRLQVGPEELTLIYREMGGRAGFPEPGGGEE